MAEDRTAAPRGPQDFEKVLDKSTTDVASFEVRDGSLFQNSGNSSIVLLGAPPPDSAIDDEEHAQGFTQVAQGLANWLTLGQVKGMQVTV